MLAANNASSGVAPKPLSAHLVRMGDLGNVPRQEKKFKVCCMGCEGISAKKTTEKSAASRKAFGVNEVVGRANAAYTVTGWMMLSAPPISCLPCQAELREE